MKTILLIFALTALAPEAFASCYRLSGPDGAQLNSICFAKEGQVKLIGPRNFTYSFQSNLDFTPAGSRCLRPSIENGICLFGLTATPAYDSYSSNNLPGGFLDAQVTLEGTKESAVGTLKFNDIIYEINP